MRKGIFSKYRERLIEISGNSKCLYLKSVSKKGAFDIGSILVGRDEKVAEFVEFLWSDGKKTIDIISPKEKNAVLDRLDIKLEPRHSEEKLSAMSAPEREKYLKKREKEEKDADARAIASAISRLKEIEREAREIEKETGRYELYIGYPFVFGVITQGFNKTPIKAPLMLFPVKIDCPDENTVTLSLNDAEKIRINPAFVFAYAQAQKLNVEQLDLEYDDLSSFRGIEDVFAYLAEAGIKIEAGDSSCTKNVFGYTKQKEPSEKGAPELRSAAVLARFPLSNSIYSDYSEIIKKKLTNDAIDELMRTDRVKLHKKSMRAMRAKKRAGTPHSYVIKRLDHAQYEVVRRVDEYGNMVIWGPPGTGKSQTIVNVITDAICKNKRVLVVSQKKAALDVVFNRLGALNDRAIYINDETKERRAFYAKCLAAHESEMERSPDRLAEIEARYNEICEKKKREADSLEVIYRVLNEKRPFGLSLSEMYSASYMISKNSQEDEIYERLIENKAIMAMDYKTLCDALFGIKSNDLEKTYHSFMQDKEKNPLIDHMQSEIDIRTLAEVKATLLEIQKTKKGFFNTAKYPYYRQVMAYYGDIGDEETLDTLVAMETKLRYHKFFGRRREMERIKAQYRETISAIESFVEEYDCLNRVLTKDGYIAVIDNILRGNSSYIKLVYEALDNYIAKRDVSNLLLSLDKEKIDILNFAYRISKSYSGYLDVIDKLLEIRIYHEITLAEAFYKDELAKIIDFPNITARIARLEDEELAAAHDMVLRKSAVGYRDYYNTAKDNKDYLYQISKTQKHAPIRRTLELYEEYILSLFPCWLLSPENVSAILPLKKNMFDVVIFDEASQVFIESTIPTIYRGKNVVVAGDSKQLPPSENFMKRYLGAEPDEEDDPAKLAALEVKSLLDLAVARYESANLTCHYRSRSSELIDFSNHAFYDGNLQVAPNISKNKTDRPIIRIKVPGKWIDRKNAVEAKAVVDLLREIFEKREANESIGIITFNAEQQTAIADQIDRECQRSPEFRSAIITERNRTDNGEDTSLFIKNLENVQGDERDIIIFSVAYAENAEGRIHTSFGSLSAEGGENRLNVAITRARRRIYVVTSIEPEQLRVEGAKHPGPKLLKKYLMYARAVSLGNDEEVAAILSELDSGDKPAERRLTRLLPVEERIKERLEKLGYTVDVALGDRSSRISLAIYDEETDRYLVGVELDKDAMLSSASAMERDVYKPRFLESRGWNLMRVWCRDFWLYPNEVIKNIAAAAKKSKGTKKTAKKK